MTKKYALLAIILLFFTLWWVMIRLLGLQEDAQNYFFAATYGLAALVGGYWGMFVSKKWGGQRSYLGKGIMLLSIGLLAQEFGQVVFSYYNIFLHKEIPYPSIADFGFFGSVIFYIWALVYFFKVTGAELNLKKVTQKIGAALFPMLLLFVSYFIFLQSYEVDFSNPVRVFLDFAYPLGQALYLSLALLIYSFSRSVLGGVMRSPVLFVIVALLLQYIADFNFLWQNINGTWVNGRYGDFLYFIAYVGMAFVMLRFESIFNKVKEKK